MVQSPPDNAPAQDGVRLVIKPRVRGFICVTTHPAGCEANVRQQIDYVRKQGPIAGAQARAGDRRVHRLRPGRAHQRGLRRRRADAGRVLRAPVRAIQAGHARLAQQRRLPQVRPGRGPVRPQHQWRCLLRRDQAPGHRGHPRRPGPGRPGGIQPGRAPQPSARRQGLHLGAQARGPLRQLRGWIPTARSCANPRWNRRRRTKSTPPSP